MKRLPYFLLVLLLAFAPVVQAKDAPAIHYVAPTSIDVKALLPAPPANGSPTTLKELDLMVQMQQTRTPEEVARIKAAVKPDVFLFAGVFGSWFTAKDLPLTTALFQKVDDDIHPIIESAKKDWDRPRPSLQDKRVHPPIDLPKNTSYPSGHATLGELYGLILSEMAPDLKASIMARGRQIGDDRVLAGVHFPSDVAAGRILADNLFAQFMASPAFRSDLAQAKAELAAVRAKH